MNRKPGAECSCVACPFVVAHCLYVQHLVEDCAPHRAMTELAAKGIQQQDAITCQACSASYSRLHEQKHQVERHRDEACGILSCLRVHVATSGAVGVNAMTRLLSGKPQACA